MRPHPLTCATSCCFAATQTPNPGRLPSESAVATLSPGRGRIRCTVMVPSALPYSAATHVHRCVVGPSFHQPRRVFPTKPVVDELFHEALHLSPPLPGEDDMHLGKGLFGKEEHHRPLSFAVSLSLPSGSRDRSVIGDLLFGDGDWRSRSRIKCRTSLISLGNIVEIFAGHAYTCSPGSMRAVAPARLCTCVSLPLRSFTVEGMGRASNKNATSFAALLPGSTS